MPEQAVPSAATENARDDIGPGDGGARSMYVRPGEDGMVISKLYRLAGQQMLLLTALSA